MTSYINVLIEKTKENIEEALRQKDARSAHTLTMVLLSLIEAKDRENK